MKVRRWAVWVIGGESPDMQYRCASSRAFTKRGAKSKLERIEARRKMEGIYRYTNLQARRE